MKENAISWRQTWILLPVYNESERIAAVIGRWRAVLADQGHCYHILVVDDGSTDDTRSHLRIAGEGRDDLTVVHHETNRGLGATLRTGFRRCAALAAEDDVIVAMDGDNTHPPEIFPSMVERMRFSACDVVIASRFQPGASIKGLSRSRTVLGRGASTLFRWVRPIHGVRDYTCGYRLYRASAIRDAIDRFGDEFCFPSGFEATACLLLQVASLDRSFQEVPLPLDYSPKRGRSHMPKSRTILQTGKLLLQLRRYELQAGPGQPGPR